jgi:hypothetical protein
VRHELEGSSEAMAVVVIAAPDRTGSPFVFLRSQFQKLIMPWQVANRPPHGTSGIRPGYDSSSGKRSIDWFTHDLPISGERFKSTAKEQDVEHQPIEVLVHAQRIFRHAPNDRCRKIGE